MTNLLKVFERKGHLKTHQKSKTCYKNCDFICSLCTIGFTTKEKLQTHMNSFNCKKRYKCDQCDNYFRHQHELFSHFESFHNES